MYLFSIVFILVLIVVPLQLQFNIFRINKQREEDDIHKAYEIDINEKEQQHLVKEK